ncbi:tryptophan synthase subunit alpha [Alkalispirochaeta sphaeroplastigenens]|uniref:Tryptophan synthase alpha chain n=1 Tax=Alkalispirochaeta sphaeroplastigenens TaxID=1187066 RepID=A0A2S4JX19_9SPIO|nr:tryptophan synthase subunit alpha [Alkalispirochaeta sphaeroplastigenens]POR04079.1 tryptophan synthase subunit alpha [Alkalispirochaeta sphaeroplastigenens]
MPAVMAHMIPCYPDLATSREIARALVAGGVTYLEIQFPYSDPAADGPVIQAATAEALRQGFTPDTGWNFVENLTRQEETPPVFVMSYAGLVYARGVDRFVREAADRGVAGVIVPDLPLDSDEGLQEAGRRYGVEVVPVIAFGAAPERIDLVHRSGSAFVYAALRRGITGSETLIGPETIAFLRELQSSGAQVLAGFGVSTPDQVRAVTEHAHAAVVGSAFVRVVGESLRQGHGTPSEKVRALASQLVGNGEPEMR